MKLIRLILGKLILLVDRTFPPRRLHRSATGQAQAEALARRMALYQFEACPFCVKVRRAMLRMNIAVELRDAKDPRRAQELLAGGGKLQVPCLKVSEDSAETARWIYESSDIIAYLDGRLRSIP